MTDDRERERLAAKMVQRARFLRTTAAHEESRSDRDARADEYAAIARLLREPVNARLLTACKAAIAWYALDGDGISDPTRQVIGDAIAAAESSPRSDCPTVMPPLDVATPNALPVVSQASVESAPRETPYQNDPGQVALTGIYADRLVEVSHERDALTARIAELEASRPIRDGSRLLDLVRYQRAELHDTGLITDEEYAELVNVGSQSARRLEEYDAMRAECNRLTERIAELEADLKMVSSDYQSLGRAADDLHAELARLRAAPRVGVEEVIARLHSEVFVHGLGTDAVERTLRECWLADGKGE